MTIENLLREFVLLEVSAWKKRGVDFDPLYDLKKWVGKGAYVFFGDIDKLGINPQFAYTKPFGIWSYPLDSRTFDEIVNGEIRFAGDRKFIQIFRPKIPGSILDLNSVSEQDATQARSELEQLGFHVPDETINPSWDPPEMLWMVTKRASKGSPVTWSKLLRKLGYDGMLDRDRNLAVFFSKDAVVHLSTVRNPALKKQR